VTVYTTDKNQKRRRPMASQSTRTEIRKSEWIYSIWWLWEPWTEQLFHSQ